MWLDSLKNIMLGMYSKDGIFYMLYNNIPVDRSSVETCLQKPLIIHPYNPAINVLQYIVAELVCYYERKQEGSWFTALCLYGANYTKVVPFFPIWEERLCRYPSFKWHVFVNKNSNICAMATIISVVTKLSYLICGCLDTSCLFEPWSISVHLVFLLILNICSAFLMSMNIVLITQSEQ